MELMADLFDILYEEKDNFSNENTYLKLCNILKNMGEQSKNQHLEVELNNERENNDFLRASRKKLIKENNKLKKMIKLV